MNISKITLTGILGLLIPSLTIIFVGTSIFLAHNWFDWRFYALSNLGASEDSRLVFNFGLMIVGILILVFALMLIYETYRETKLFLIPTLLLLASGIALFGIGYYPMDIAPETHWEYSVAFFTLLGFGMLAYGIYYLVRKEKLLGILGIVGFLNDIIMWKFVPWEALGITGVAIPEALSALIPMIWITILSIKILKEERIPA